jgi:hypothetical protein
MANFRILQLEIDNKYSFFRRETEGSSTIGASGGYKSEDVIAHFKLQLDNKTRKGMKPTRMDQVGGTAKFIKVSVLHTLSDCDVQTADAKKADEIATCKRQYPGRVINVQ